MRSSRSSSRKPEARLERQSPPSPGSSRELGVLVNQDMEILYGEEVLEIRQRLGWEEVLVCILPADLDDDLAQWGANLCKPVPTQDRAGRILEYRNGGLS
ncbi:MAG: hypothetical protein O7H41_21420 [Planctomycetota bacterium]|nr:hypothetical protein [Planctomycetota bacterium]